MGGPIGNGPWYFFLCIYNFICNDIIVKLALNKNKKLINITVKMINITVKKKLTISLLLMWGTVTRKGKSPNEELY